MHLNAVIGRDAGESELLVAGCLSLLEETVLNTCKLGNRRKKAGCSSL
jgi:hypothetical protein